MTLDALIREIRALPIEERKQLVMAILDTLTEEQPSRKGSIMDFKGIGAPSGGEYTEADKHIRELREEWDHRP
jgi:hypothetical protein